MNYPRVASRYSKALLELAVEKNELERVSADVAALKAAVSGSRDLELLLASPIVKTDKKQAILNEVFKGAFSSIFEGFVSLITCLLYTSPSPRDLSTSRMPSSA